MRLTEQMIEDACYEGRCTVGKGGRKRWSTHIVWEEGGSGLGLRISSTGKKSFVASVRSGGRKRVQTLGPVGELSLDEARDRATELTEPPQKGRPRAKRREARSRSEAEGVDPAVESVAGRSPRGEEELSESAPPEAPKAAAGTAAAGATNPRTVGELAEAFLEQHLKHRAASCYTEQRMINSRIKPIAGGVPLDRFTRRDLGQLRVKFRTVYPREAARLSKLVTSIFAWASERDLWPVSDLPGAGEPADGPTGEAARPEAEQRSADELAAALAAAEEEREALKLRIQELSESGGEMVERLSALAAARERLEAELARVREEPESDSEEAWPESARTEIGSLRHKIAVMMAGAERSEAEAAKLRGQLEAKTQRQASLARELEALRGQLAEQAAELERSRAAAAEPPPPAPAPSEPAPSPRAVRRPPWLVVAAAAAGALAGALFMYWVAAGRPGEPAAVEEPARARAEDSRAAAGGEPAEPVVTGAEATPSEPPQAPEPAAGPEHGAIEETIRDWANAWSQQRVEEYLAFYGERFRPPNGASRADWERQRRDRILRPGSIRVTLGPLARDVLAPDRVRVSFDQTYRTETYSDETRKTLVLEWSEGRWTIVEERSE